MTNELPSIPPLVVLFSTDLMLMSSVGGAAAAAGLRYCCVSVIPDALGKVVENQTIVCLDLSAPEAEPMRLARSIPESVLQSSIAFGPHVHVAKLEQARVAGFARVLSRGQFISKIKEELMSAAIGLKAAD